MAAATFVAESVPNFGVLLNLVGGSTVMFASFLFPPLFYLCLNAKESLLIEGQNHASNAPNDTVKITLTE